MEPIEYDRMAAVEQSMWWYRSLHRRLLFFLRKYSATPTVSFLDAGCGTGGFLHFASPYFEKGKTFGVDYYFPAAQMAKKKSGFPVACASINQLPFKGQNFQCVISADVLGQRTVDPNLAIQTICSTLKKNGCLILQLPAYQWLFSYHDKHVYNIRRFHRAEAVKLLATQNMKVVYAGYWCCFVFPLLLIRRFLLPAPKDGSDVQKYSPFANFLLTFISRCEEWLMRLGVRFPFGSSILVVGIKND